MNRRNRTEEFNIWPSFTDVVTGIFLFLIFIFIVLIIQQFLYSVRLSELEKFLGTLEDEMNSLQEAFNSKKSGIDVKVDQGRIILPEKILFDTNSSVIKEGSKEKLRGIGYILKDILDREITLGRKDEGKVRNSDILYVSIDGHTDSIGSYEFNIKLGSDRAISVLNFLIYNVGMDPKTYDISANTYGEYKPVSGIDYMDNLDVPENRRIEIRIMPKFEELLNLVGSSE